MPTASELSLAFSPKGGSLSPGTLKTSVESLGNGGRVRADGKIIKVPIGHKSRKIDFVYVQSRVFLHFYLLLVSPQNFKVDYRTNRYRIVVAGKAVEIHLLFACYIYYIAFLFTTLFSWDSLIWLLRVLR